MDYVWVARAVTTVETTPTPAVSGRTMVGAPSRQGPSELLLACASATLAAALAGEAVAPVLCHGVAQAFDASAAAHVRFDRVGNQVSLCLWRRESTLVSSTVTVVQPGPVDGAAGDWWLSSVARPLVRQWFQDLYLAEIPLDPGPGRPSLMVLGRPEPLAAGPHSDLLRAAVHLRILEQAVSRVADSAPPVDVPALPVPSPRRAVARPAARARPAAAARPAAVAEPLTVREHEVLVLLSRGLLARTIAQQMDVSERTVHKHLSNIYRKLDAHDRLLAVRRAESLGLLTSPTEVATVDLSSVEVPGPRTAEPGAWW